MSKNILFVANYESNVGYAWWLMENFWVSISKYFISSQCFLIFPIVNDISSAIDNSSIKVLQHDFSDTSFFSLLKLKKIVIENKIRVLYLTDRKYSSYIYFLLRTWGVRSIILHDHMPGERGNVSFLKFKLKKIIHLFNFFSCDCYIGVSKFIFNRFIDIAAIPKTKCHYVHNGIKVFSINDKFYAHDVFDIPQNAKIIVTTGRATYYKGVDLILKVAFEIFKNKQNYNNLYFLHIGSGPDLEEFKVLAQKYGISQYFIFAGFRNDVIKILPSCDIAIQMSLGEAFSLSILEYLCAGLPTLAPDNCGNPEAIQDGVTGFLFKPGDISEVVNKIRFLLDNPDYARSIGLSARKSVEDKFSIELCNENFIKIIDQQISSVRSCRI